MRGGAGDDTYFVDGTLDKVIENMNEGIDDTVFSSVNFSLGSNLENLTLTGSAVSGTGNGLANVIAGSAAANTLNGGAGNDRVIGNDGSDTLTGGTGIDTFVFTPGFGRDMVTDFRASGLSNDHIEFSTSVFSDFAAVNAAMRQVGSDVVITLDAANSVTLKNVTFSSLDSGDFFFV
jgi:Ca2+-binding RTX toxin-like protein